jgi:hypothetical protein
VPGGIIWMRTGVRQGEIIEPEIMEPETIESSTKPQAQP